MHSMTSRGEFSAAARVVSDAAAAASARSPGGSADTAGTAARWPLVRGLRWLAALQGRRGTGFPFRTGEGSSPPALRQEAEARSRMQSQG